MTDKKIFLDGDAKFYSAKAGELYRPRNGTEGDYFMGVWCATCCKNASDQWCEINLNVLARHIDDPDYPKEWIWRADGQPQCTAWTDDQTAPSRCAETLDLLEAANAST
jgi:hypothetical protein